MFTVRRALLSVSDKRGLIPFAQGLADLGVELVSTGGTCRTLREAGLDVIEVSEKTGFPEIMDGRVKTLHPKIHGGLLGRRGTDEATMDEHGIEPIDLLAVNLYPFEQTIARKDATIHDAIDNIDIGGPAMIRAASKNHDGVAVVVDPNDYDAVLESLKTEQLSLEARRKLAAKAYAHTASYDTAITQYLSASLDEPPLGDRILYSGRLVERMRYGENPHQEAGFYIDQQAPAGSLATATQLQGKALSYNNIADSDAALECVKQFDAPACVIVKHANPCGVAVAGTILEAYEKAFQTDPTSAFGGIIAFNEPLDAATAKSIIDRQFVEVIVAPEIDADAADVLKEKKNVRLDGGRLRFQKGVRRPASADLRHGPNHGRRPQGGYRKSPNPGADRGHAVRLDRGQVRQVERHHLLQGQDDDRRRRRPDEPRLQHEDRRHQGRG
jgi:phosphoribosylaminoimidazolecarboxamide formyltransferase/IMP cyclohydrolase